MTRFIGYIVIVMGLALLAVPATMATQEEEEAPALRGRASFQADEFAEEPGRGPVVENPYRVRTGPVAPASRQPTGALTGRIVYTSGGHGWTANQDDTGTLDGVWYTQRGDNNEIVEDLQNQDQLTMFADYCFNAGATVVPMRPVHNQTIEIVLDNDDAGVVFTGAWSNSTSTVYYGSPADVPYRFAATSAAESATARYTPTITQADFYPVHCWTRGGVDRVDDQLYRVVHSGGTSEIRINHRMVGNGWIYLGTYYFETGTSGYVEISNESADTVPASPVVIADAIRFGNGMGDIDRGGGVSGQPREDEASRYWIQASIGQGGSSGIYNSSSSDQNDNVSTPNRMAGNMNRETEGAMTDRIFISFHSNASPGSIGLYNGNNDPATATPNQFRLAELIGRECNDDLVAIGSPPLEGPWLDLGPNPGDVTLDRSDIEFGEINNLSGINDEFDATIIEVAGHVGGDDPVNLRNPNVRNWLARASLQAAVRYFNEFGGGTLAFLPEPPTNVRAISNGSGGVTVSWAAPAVDGIGGDAATGYVVYRSSNGYGFGNPVVVAGVGSTSTTINGLTPGEITYFRVAATNAGGESMPSETIAAKPYSAGNSPILIVNGFDRLDRFMNPRETAAAGLGGPAGGGDTYDRVKPRMSNSFDYVIAHARAIDTAGFFFDSTSNEAVEAGQVLLTNYDTVVWILGEESTTDHTFSATEQSLVSTFISGGGSLFVSGSEIGWDLEAQGNGLAFYQNTLRSDYISDDAATHTVAGGTSIFSTVGSFGFDDGSSVYDVDWPDTLAAINGSVVCLTYSGGAGAALQWPSGSINGQIVMLGFPFETITSATARDDIMALSLAFFGTVPAELSVFSAD